MASPTAASPLGLSLPLLSASPRWAAWHWVPFQQQNLDPLQEEEEEEDTLPD